MSEQAGINNVLLVAVEVGETLNRLQIPYCFIGGVANQRWGEPRQTVDVDATSFVVLRFQTKNQELSTKNQERLFSH